MAKKKPTAENVQPEILENVVPQIETTADVEEISSPEALENASEVIEEITSADIIEAKPVEEIAAPVEETKDVVIEIVESAVEVPEPIEEAIEPVEELVESASEDHGPVIETIESVEESIEPAIETAGPVATTVEILLDAVEPIAEPVAEPVEITAEIPESVTEVAEPAMETVEPAIEAVEPAAEANEPVEEPVVLSSEETKLAVPVAVEHDHDLESSPDALIIHEISQLDAEVEHEEEEEELLEEQEEIVEKYDTYSREQLVEVLEDTVKEENVLKIKTRVSLIKVAFLKLSKEYRQQKLEEFIKAGGARESYVPEPDQLMEKFNTVFEIYKKNKAHFNEQQEVIKLRNLDAKKAILEELKELINSDETLKKTYDRFKELQVKWKEIGLVPSTEINNLWQNYHFLVEKFFDKVKISKELRDLDLKKNLEKKIELCEKAEELLIEPSVVRSFQQLQKYHEEWKEIGPVPQDKRDDIWERFKTATDKINERRRDHYNVLAKDQESNLLAKTALCEKAEQIVTLETDSLKEWQDRTREINDLFKVWKTIGPAPKKENDEIWERFKAYINTFFSTKKDYFNKLKQEQTNNYNLKLDIVKQAEAIKDSTDWRSTTQDLINLQKEWKNIGPVPRKHSDKIWKRFRAACDEFFQNKAKHFSTVVESEKENLDKKLDLIKRVEEWKAGANKNQNLEALKGFQREWTEIGHVPIKEKNKIHDAFRVAVNKHLDDLNISSFEMRTPEYRPRQDYESEGSGDGRGRRGGGGDSGSLSMKATKLREEILLWENNIGFLAHSKNAEILRKEFELKIQKAKEELALYEAKLKSMHESR
jgi:hypothetical protein